MSGFIYKDGVLHADGVSLPEVAAQVGTPAYVYSATRLAANYKRLKEALPEAQLCFAVKANGNLAVLKLLAGLGAGADIVSGGELKRAIAAGFAPGKIVFSGVGKTADEISAALNAGIHQLNAESLEELNMIEAAAARLGVRAPVALRVNPDVAADTHHKIATGRKGDKFGIDHEQLPQVLARLPKLAHVEVLGLAVHIGSQLFDIDTYQKAYGIVGDYVTALRQQGAALTRLDLGGGMGVPYQPGQREFDCAVYAGMVRQTLGNLGCALTLEPGRFIVADAGVLLSRVTLIKQGVSERFVILDAAMNDLIRPAMYESYHHIRPVHAPAAGAALEPANIVGPVCETGDSFASERPLPRLVAGDLVVLETAGAYGAVMGGTYNARDLCPEVLVSGEKWAVVRERIRPETQMQWDNIPDWV